MPRYRFLTTWILDAPREAVWEAIHDCERWPAWWEGVRTVRKVAAGDGHGVGSVFEHEWRGRVPYTVRFRIEATRVEPPHLIEGAATGELEGTGRWRFFAGRETAVAYEWDVRTTAAWMNAVAPVARPLFRANHDWVMGRGGDGLARLLGANLIARD